MKTPGTSHRRTRDHACTLLTLSHSHRRSHRAKESDARAEKSLLSDVSDLEGEKEGEELLGSEVMPRSRYGSTAALPCGGGVKGGMYERGGVKGGMYERGGVKGGMYERLVESYTSSEFDSKSGHLSTSRASTCSGVLTYGSISEVPAEGHRSDGGVLTYGSISEVPAEVQGSDGGVLTYGSISEAPAEVHRDDDGVLTYGSISEAPAEVQGSDGGVLTYGSISEAPAEVQGSDGVLTYATLSEVPAEFQRDDGGVSDDNQNDNQNDKDFPSVEEGTQESSENRTK